MSIILEISGLIILSAIIYYSSNPMYYWGSGTLGLMGHSVFCQTAEGAVAVKVNSSLSLQQLQWYHKPNAFRPTTWIASRYERMLVWWKCSSQEERDRRQRCTRKKMQINNYRKSDKQHQKGKCRTEKQKWKKKSQRRYQGRRELFLYYLFYFPEYLIRYRVLFEDRLFKIRWRNSDKVNCFWINVLIHMSVLFTMSAPQWSSSFNDDLHFHVKFVNFCIARNVSLDKKLLKNAESKWMCQKN